MIFTLQGCDLGYEDKPGLSTIVKGRITDYYTHRGIRGVKFAFVDRKRNAYLFGLSDTRTDTIHTDTFGYYCYEFITETMRDYAIEPKSTNGYYYDDWGRYIVEGSVNTNNFTYKPYYKLHLKLINKYKYWDLVDIADYMTDPISGISLRGTEIDTVVDLRIVPDEKNKFNIHLNKNKGYQYTDDALTFYLTGTKDTTIVLIY